MTEAIAAIAPWLAGVVVSLVVAAFGWWRVEAHGQEKARRRAAEAERDASNEAAERMRGALPDSGDMLERIDRMLDDDGRPVRDP